VAAFDLPDSAAGTSIKTLYVHYRWCRATACALIHLNACNASKQRSSNGRGRQDVEADRDARACGAGHGEGSEERLIDAAAEWGRDPGWMANPGDMIGADCC
jgi:hypothetical protein